MKRPLLVLIVVALLAALVCGIGFLVSQNPTRILTDAVSHGLLACYDAATSVHEGVISPDRLREIIQADLDAPAEKTHLLPSFVRTDDVRFANRAVAIGSSNIVCAVRLGEGKYCAVRANRTCVLLDQRGMDAWAHRQ